MGGRVFSFVSSCFLTRIDTPWCCCVTSTSLCLQSRASADVAVHLILVATIVQLSRRQEFWERRGYSVEFAAARICREAGARVRTNVVHDSSRLEILAEACHCMAACSWPLTPLLCQPSISMGPPVAAPFRLTVLSLPKCADAKRAHISRNGRHPEARQAGGLCR